MSVPQRLQNMSDTPRRSLLPQSQHKAGSLHARGAGGALTVCQGNRGPERGPAESQGLGAPACLPPWGPGLGRPRQRPFFEAFRQSPGFRPQPTGKHPPRPVFICCPASPAARASVYCQLPCQKYARTNAVNKWNNRGPSRLDFSLICIKWGAARAAC